MYKNSLLRLYLVALGLVFIILSCQSTSKYSKHYPESASDPNYNPMDTDKSAYRYQHLTQEQFDNLLEHEKAEYLESMQKQVLDEQINMPGTQKGATKSPKIQLLSKNGDEPPFKPSYNDPQSVINSMSSTNSRLNENAEVEYKIEW